MCLFNASFSENQDSLNSLPFFLGSVVMLSKSKLCPLLEACAYNDDVSSCRRIAA